MSQCQQQRQHREQHGEPDGFRFEQLTDHYRFPSDTHVPGVPATVQTHDLG